MKTALQINTSIHFQAGHSTRLAEDFVGRLHANNPDLELIVRDLGAEPVPHLDAERFKAFMAKPGERNARQQSVVDFSDALIAELRRADIIVLGLPMYNFGVPSQLKAYFDHVARAGETFKYSETGPVGLLKGKSAYVLATRGGRYAGTPLDTQTGYVRDFLRFIGIEQVQFILAEGLATGEENKVTAIGNARTEIVRIVDTEFAEAA